MTEGGYKLSRCQICCISRLGSYFILCKNSLNYQYLCTFILQLLKSLQGKQTPERYNRLKVIRSQSSFSLGLYSLTSLYPLLLFHSHGPIRSLQSLIDGKRKHASKLVSSPAQVLPPPHFLQCPQINLPKHSIDQIIPLFQNLHYSPLTTSEFCIQSCPYWILIYYSRISS